MATERSSVSGGDKKGEDADLSSPEETELGGKFAIIGKHAMHT